MPWESNDRQLSLEYVAGLLDGEGNIGFYLRKGGGDYLTSLVAITNTYRPILDQLARQFGGRVVSKPAVPGHKPVFIWRISGIANAIDFLTPLMPHLHIKRERATLLLEIGAMCERKNRQVGIRGTWPADLFNGLRAATARMRHLNLKGTLNQGGA